MLALIFAGLLGTAAIANAEATCPENDHAADYHLTDVCSPLAADAPAYSATYRVSLSPQPAAQQVTIHRLDGGWVMNIAGYRWTPGSEVVTRRREIAISNDDAQQLADRLTQGSMEQLATLPYYGGGDVICTDGARYELAMASGGNKLVASQHSCAGKTKINETMAYFRALALKYDPEFEDLLSGLRN